MSTFSERYAAAADKLARSQHEEGLEAALALLADYPGHPDVANLAGALYARLRRLHEAVDVWSAALALQPEHEGLRGNLGRAYAELADMDAAVDCLESLLRRNPSCGDNEMLAHLFNLLFAMWFRMPQQPEMIALRTREWGAHLRNTTLSAPCTLWPSSPQPERRLRIGLVSGDLRDHPVGYFIEGLLRDPSAAQADWVAFDNHPESTPLRTRIETTFVRWYDIKGKGVDEVVALVQREAIDVLVDLSGLTRHQRLDVFTRRAAPLQLTWLGYFGTTGLDCLDGVIADPHCVPVAEEYLFTEPVLRMPATRMSFTPPADAPPVAPLPALARGHVTYGCFQQLAKINDAVLALWRKVLEAVPTARLRIQNERLAHVGSIKDFAQRLLDAGIPLDRVSLHGAAHMPQYLAAHGEIDIVLDTFGYPGGTTTADALWMGVPTITLAMPGMLGRQGQALMTAAGLPDWVASDEDEYLRLAVHWSDPGRWSALAQLRAGMRDHLLQHPLFDRSRFARDWHALVRAAWRARCARGWEVLPRDAVPVLATSTAPEPVPRPPLSEDFAKVFAQALATLEAGDLPEAKAQAAALHARHLEDPRAAELLAVVHTRVGEFEPAVVLLEQALSRVPGHPGMLGSLAFCCMRLGTAAREANRHADALGWFDRILALQPEHADALANRSIALRDLNRFDEAVASAEQALAVQPEHFLAAFMVGSAHEYALRYDAAAHAYERALSMHPGAIDLLANLAFVQHRRMPQQPMHSAENIRRHGAALSRTRTPLPASARERDLDPARRLRIGLVSADLNDHPVGLFIEGLLMHPRSREVDWVAFHNSARKTALTRRIQPAFAAWHEIAGVRDDAVADAIVAEGIDILIDLSGLTMGHRLGVFLKRPCPVQLTWLGYFGTTGLTCFDGIIADPICVPPGEEGWFSEPVLRLPHTRLCMLPPPDAPAVGPLPALRNGHITFGSFQQMGKINDAVLALWSRILHELPDARLHVQCPQLDVPVLADAFRRRLQAQGIDAERVTLSGKQSRPEYLQAYGDIDIVLDTFGFPGGTTTVEALWMGVPTIALATPGMLGRQGEGLLTAAGLADWVARTTDDYVAMAVERAGPRHRASLARLRADLRERLAGSPLFDQDRFAAGWHALLRQAWQRHCTAQTVPMKSSDTASGAACRLGQE